MIGLNEFAEGSLPDTPPAMMQIDLEGIGQVIRTLEKVIDRLSPEKLTEKQRAGLWICLQLLVGRIEHWKAAEARLEAEGKV